MKILQPVLLFLWSIYAKTEHNSFIFNLDLGIKFKVCIDCHGKSCIIAIIDDNEETYCQ